MTAALRQEIAIHYRELEIVAEVPIDGQPALIVYSPQTEAVVRDPSDLVRWFSGYAKTQPAPAAAGQRLLF